MYIKIYANDGVTYEIHAGVLYAEFKADATVEVALDRFGQKQVSTFAARGPIYLMNDQGTTIDTFNRRK